MAETSRYCAEVWLASPEAAELLDPARLAGTARAEWSALRTERRRRDWRSSRALLEAIAVPAGTNRSLSHSRGYAALAVTPGELTPGVDVEWLAPRDFRGMSSLAYDVAECASLASLDDPARLAARFYELWTLKEAFAKALRLPLADALRRCCFPDAGGEVEAVIPTSRAWRATVFAPRPQLRLSVVCLADVAASLAGEMRTGEFPRACGGPWPVTLELSSDGRSRRAAW